MQTILYLSLYFVPSKSTELKKYPKIKIDQKREVGKGKSWGKSGGNGWDKDGKELVKSEEKVSKKWGNWMG